MPAGEPLTRTRADLSRGDHGPDPAARSSALSPAASQGSPCVTECPCDLTRGRSHPGRDRAAHHPPRAANRPRDGPPQHRAGECRAAGRRPHEAQPLARAVDQPLHRRAAVRGDLVVHLVVLRQVLRRRAAALVRRGTRRRRGGDDAPADLLPSRGAGRRPSGDQRRQQRDALPPLPPGAAGGRVPRRPPCAGPGDPGVRHRGRGAVRRGRLQLGAVARSAHTRRRVPAAAARARVGARCRRARQCSGLDALRGALAFRPARLGRRDALPVDLRRRVQRDRGGPVHADLVGEPAHACRVVRRARGRVPDLAAGVPPGIGAVRRAGDLEARRPAGRRLRSDPAPARGVGAAVLGRLDGGGVPTGRGPCPQRDRGPARRRARPR